MSPQFKEFQVNGYTEHEVQAFLDAISAKEQSVEDWTGAYADPGMNVFAWGVTNVSTKQLNQLADLMGVALIGCYQIVSYCPMENKE